MLRETPGPVHNDLSKIREFTVCVWQKTLNLERVNELIVEGVKEWGANWPKIDEAESLLRHVALSSDWVDFLTLPAYERLVSIEQ